MRTSLSGRVQLRSGADPETLDGGKPLARLLAEQVFSRIAGSASVQGNGVRLLRDAAENYPAWLAAIRDARVRVDFENYIIEADETGQMFADALCAKARQGVRVRVLYDWLGCVRTPRRFWAAMRRAGIEVRVFNRPRLDSPIGWLSRNHRKTLGIDGEVGFVSGLCVGRMWVGDPARGVPPWRDTGVEIRGPAVADIEAAFEQSWREAGGSQAGPSGPVPRPAAAGEVALRVIGSRPNTMGLYRLDQLVAALARRTLWLTDAYFVGTTAYVRALCDAARDGVDVRLLVPGASDIPITKAIARAGYRPLLEAGIRVFEWNGPMLHAKTAVADGRWARIGSSNLNLASWIGNWELDVAIEDAGFAEQMEAMFLQDLENATEIVLDLGKVHATRTPEGVPPRRRRSAFQRGRLRSQADARPPRRGSPGRLAAGAVGIGSAVSAAITNHRALGPAEDRVMVAAAALLLALAAVALLVPRIITLPLACICVLVAGALLVRSWKTRFSRSAQGPPQGPPE